MALEMNLRDEWFLLEVPGGHKITLVKSVGSEGLDRHPELLLPEVKTKNSPGFYSKGMPGGRGRASIDSPHPV